MLAGEVERSLLTLHWRQFKKFTSNQISGISCFCSF